MKLHYKAFDLHLYDTFKIAHDERDVQQTLIVGLEHQGRMGFGEATASKYYQRPVASIIEILEKNRHHIEKTPFESLELFIEDLQSFFQGNNFALCALDVAAHDLYGKINGVPIHQYWGLDTSRIPLTNYTIGIDELSKMESKIKAFPWPVYKIKLGTDDDLNIVQALRKITDAVFRVDANCAWTAAQTIEYAKSFKELGVEFIEQPLAAGDWEGMAEVYKHSTLPIMMVRDEPSSSGMTNSPTAGMNTSRKPASTPGKDNGKVMVRNARQGRAPRSPGASSRLKSMRSSVAYSGNIMNGR